MTNFLNEKFEKTKLAGAIAASALDEICYLIKPGISTNDIDKKCLNLLMIIMDFLLPLNYRDIQKSCCTSVNHVVRHGIPSDKILKEGDIVNIDVTVFKDEWHGDTSRMYYVGDVSVKADKLVRSTYESMMKAIKILRKGFTR